MSKVNGICPKCKHDITATFNPSLTDLFDKTSNKSRCPNCNVLLKIDIEVEKKYRLKAEVITDNH